MHLKNWSKYANICTFKLKPIKSLFNDSYRYLKLHIIDVSKKDMLFHTLHKPIYKSLFYIQIKEKKVSLQMTYFSNENILQN
jgi:hypothetical protein